MPMGKPKSAVSQPDYQLKHRVVGAIMVVTLAVLVIPLLLSEPQISPALDANATVSANVNANADKKTFRAPIEAPTATRNADTAPDEKQNSPPPKSNVNSQQKLLTIEKEKEKKPPPALPKDVDEVNQQPPPTTATAANWSVRVGTFSKQSNVDSVVGTLKQHAFKVHQTRVTTSLGGAATRIWLGPYAQRATADQVSQRLKTLLGETGFVTKHAP